MATKDAIIRRKNASGTWDTIHPQTTTSQITDFATQISSITISELNDIGDVNAGSPSDGQALVWDNSTSKWVPGDAGGGGDVQTVNGVSPDANGEVTLSASDVGAAATSHTHAISAITNLQTTLNGKQASLGTGSNNQFLRWGALGEPYWDTVTAADVGAYASNNPSGFQTAAQVAASISALVDSSPSTLDTLNELAAALGDDPNFATTVSTNIGTKVSKSGDTMSGTLVIGQVDSGNPGAGDNNLRVSGYGILGNRGSMYVTNQNTSGDIQFGIGGVHAAATKMKISSNGVVDIGGNTVFHDGYHPNADKWTTARTLSLSGDASGSVSWDGSANATLSVAVANDSHTHDGRYYTESEADSRFINTTDSYVSTDLDGSASYPRFVVNNSGASDPSWIRVTSNSHGILPYANGGSYIGTSSWRFSQIHAVNFYESGTALSSKYLGLSATAVNSDKVDGYHIVVGSTGTDTNTLYFTT